MAGQEILIPHTVGIDRAEGLAAALRDRIDAEVTIARTLAETREAVARVPVVITVRFPTELLALGESLRWVHVVSAGVNHLDLDAFKERDVVVTNSAGAHAEPIAEQVLCSLLFFERNLHEVVRNQARQSWERVEGSEIRGKTLGIVGVGAIGSRIAELGAAVGMEVIGTKRNLDNASDAVDELLPAEEYPRLLRRSDYVVLACPLTDETEGLLGAPEFAQMGNDAVLVNVARGDICVEADLVRALQQRVIRGAALDVFSTEPLRPESPLWRLSNVLVTPHVAGSSPHKFERWGDLVERNYAALRADEVAEMENRVV